MHRHLALFSCLILFALGAFACSKSIEGETKRWDSNQLSVQEYTAKYPGFKRAIDERSSAGATAMKAAEALSGEAKIKAMAAANDKVNTILSRFRAVERKIKEYDSLKGDSALRRLRMGLVQPVVDRAEAEVRHTLDMLETSRPVNAGEAIGQLKLAESSLTTALTPLKNMVKRSRRKKAAARKAKRAKKAGKAGN